MWMSYKEMPTPLKLITVHNSSVGLNEMKPNISLTLGLMAGTNLLVFGQSPQEPGLICLPLHRHVGNASVHQSPVMLGFISFSPTYHATGLAVRQAYRERQ